MRLLLCLILLSLASTPTMPVAAAPDTSACIAEFAGYEPDLREARDGTATGNYDEPASRVDVDGDGRISVDEEIVACKTDLWSRFP